MEYTSDITGWLCYYPVTVAKLRQGKTTERLQGIPFYRRTHWLEGSMCPAQWVLVEDIATVSKDVPVVYFTFVLPGNKMPELDEAIQLAQRQSATETRYRHAVV